MQKPIQRSSTPPHHRAAASPTAMLRDEHAVILRALALLERMGQVLAARGPLDRETLSWLRDFFVTFADGCHHAREERHLFPALERHGVPMGGGPLGVMLEEHQAGRALIRALGQGDDGETAETIRGYVALLRAHIYKENEVLFPIAEQLLSREEQEEVGRAFRSVEAAGAGAELHERLLRELGRLEAVMTPGEPVEEGT